MRRTSGDTTFCMILFSKAGKAWQKGFNMLIAKLSKDVLSQTHVDQKCTFCILGQYSAEQKCTVSIMSQVITQMPMVGKDVRNFASAVNKC